MNSFSDVVKDKLKSYVYALIDPRNNEIFYIGKGVNNRVFQHETEKHVGNGSNKLHRIDEIRLSGNKVKKIVLLYGLTEKEAFAAEAALINLLKYSNPGKLTNNVSGHHSGSVMTVEDVENFFGAEVLTEKDIYHNLLVIKINGLFTHGMTIQEIMDCARGHWIINTKNAQKTDYLVAVYHGIVVGVYENMKWYSSGKKTDFYPRPCEENLKLNNRKYCTCQDVQKSKYLNKNISSLVKNTQNPISYIWGRKNSIDVLKPYYNLFCDNSERNEYLFEDCFGKDMQKMGYEMDAFTKYKGTEKSEDILNSNCYQKIKDTIKDLDYLTLTSTLFSKWRYLTHWAYMDYCRYEDNIYFFKAVIERIFDLCN